MNLKRAAFSALLLSGSLAGLTGCLSGGDEESDSTDAHVEAIGNYTLSGDTLFMNLSADTSTWCSGDDLEVEIEEAHVDTTLFKIEGNTFTLYEPAEEHVDWSRLGPESTGIFIQTYVVYTRTSGGSGIEGVWTYKKPGYRVTEGTLTAEVQAVWDRNMDQQAKFLSYGKFDLIFADGKASGIMKVRRADQFLASWNGEFFDGEGFTPDSARYDAKVTVVDRNTVKIKGNKTGETVTLDFAKDGTESYTSDKAGRMPYSAVQNPATCPTEEWYEDDFLTANAKEDDLFKRGAARDKKRSLPGILPW